MSRAGTPVVLVHGLWLHATSRAPWVELIAEHGYAPVAPGYPANPDSVVEAHTNPDQHDNSGLDEITNHFSQIMTDLNRRRCDEHSLLGSVAAARVRTPTSHVARNC